MANTLGGKTGGEGIELGTQAWNIADGYTKIKILRLLIQLDIDEEVTMFGRKDDGDFIPENMITGRRVEGFEKLMFHLRQLIGNCRFSVEKGMDTEVLAELIARLANVEEFSDGIASVKFNDVTKEEKVVINQEHFDKCFNILRSVKDELNFLLNKAGLIFRQSDEIDLDKIMRDIEEGG